jgi:NAD(P)-dependent dehydrogenase (short-subunit alcohol dehydrogenase family)
MPGLPKVTPDMMGTLKNLGQIIGFLKQDSSAQPPGRPLPTVQSDPGGSAAISVGAAPPVQRYTVETVPVEPAVAHEAPSLPAGQFIGVVPDDQDVARDLVDVLQQKGLRAEVLENPDDERLSDTIAGLVVFAPIDARDAFRWARACAVSLKNAGAQGFALFSTISRLDGSFGFSGAKVDHPVQGALAGLAKTAAREWPDVRCLALDIDPAWNDPQAVARAVAAEMLCAVVQEKPAQSNEPPFIDQPFQEIGIGPGHRVLLRLVPATFLANGPLELQEDDVVVVTGGARGVTAAAATALARRTGCSMALLGRSSAPVAEPPWLTDVQEESAIKKRIMEHLDSGPVSPKIVEQHYRRWMNNRLARQTLDALAQAGIRVRYDSVDIRDAGALKQALQAVREDLGPVKAVIHGAGVLADRLISDKQTDQFDQVFETKVTGLANLLSAARDDDLRYLVLFSSVSGRLGNSGQVDYAMANEALNKVAWQQAFERPGCKVLSINWGPWDGGMVTEPLKRKFIQNGTPLISPDQGAAMMIAEMGAGGNGPVEVVIGSVWRPRIPEASPETTPEAAQRIIGALDRQASRLPEAALTLAAKREIDIDGYPVLQSHLLNGRPVVPLALMTEWLAHSALHGNPGLALHGIDQLRLLSGIALDHGKKMIRLLSGKAKRKEMHYEVDVQIRDGKIGDLEVIHSSAKAILTDVLPEPPEFKENGHFKTLAGMRSLEEIYEHILFHGHQLRGIQKIIRLTEKAMTARLATAPAPELWIQEPLRSRWISDPLVLDSAFQMAIVWCHEQTGNVCLPSYAARYRQYRERFPAEGVDAVMEVHKITDRKITADFIFLDDQKRVVACLSGYEAVMDANLARAFRAA